MTPESPVMDRSFITEGTSPGGDRRTPISQLKPLAGSVCISPEVSSQPMPWSPDAGAVNLLLSLPEIVSKEISKETIDWNDDSQGFPSVPRLDLSPSASNSENRTPLSLSFRSIFAPRLAAIPVAPEVETVEKSESDRSCRARTVSFDLCEDLASYHRSKTTAKSSAGPTAATRRIPTRKAVLERQLQKHRSERANKSKAPKLRGSGDAEPVVKTILRKKFSWKNYPELEAFLIANREEYLRHSALNYTTQQKQYNNRLTENLLELASKHGYVFDEACFNFVGVRDRIRCYYKSYVQSAKKRGIALGYAAKRAGLISVTQPIS
eukprot:CAMPEP_0194027942 /NCGR_PEP_ID=MMETSP0009_2-20130614/1975_1 /TAXON_ID=210454 /ORGANISM="Grammatophora oceanica, Strain CCMP 410" /LENGTH=322 /DNA_ID=CAMNT_0038667153 /DNA_START=112 /DNA_END=1080 /DNA_ORIENTATION=+